MASAGTMGDDRRRMPMKIRLFPKALICRFQSQAAITSGMIRGRH
jgi:hypothetical protein